MKKIIIGSLMALSLLMSSEYKEIDKKEFENIDVLNKYGVQIRNAYDAGDVYHFKALLRGKVQDVFLTKTKKTVFLGAAYSLDGKKLAIPVDMNKFIKDAAFTFGTGNDEYVVFTDPECPYCIKFEKYWHKVKDKVKFHTFFFPLDFHKNAKEMCYHVLNQKTDDDKVKTLREIGEGSKEYKNNTFTVSKMENIKKQMKIQKDIGDEMSVRGTPTVYDMSGKVVSWPSILQKHGVSLK